MIVYPSSFVNEPKKQKFTSSSARLERARRAPWRIVLSLGAHLPLLFTYLNPFLPHKLLLICRNHLKKGVKSAGILQKTKLLIYLP